MDMHKSGRGRHPQFQVPDIPEAQWCEARRLLENGTTLSQIGQQLHCDPRTVKACILRNSDQLDRRKAPRIMEPYKDFIQELIYSDELKTIKSHGKLTRKLYKLLKERKAYTGSERTVRNYLAELPLDR